MEKSIKELFVRFIANDCRPEEIEQVHQLLKTGGHEQEWEQAMAEKEHDLVVSPSLLSGLDQDRLYLNIKDIIHPEPVRSVAKTWKWLAAAAVLLMAFGAGIWFFKSKAVPQEASLALEKSKPVKMQASHKWIKLPDGSSVQLNSDSKLEYPDSFEGKKNREVTLIGEAYFDIKHKPSQPFIIHTGKIKTTVLGTAFNINAYQSGRAVTVTVTRGRVKVEDEHKLLAVLTPDQQLAWKPQVVEPLKVKVNAEQVIEWKKQDLIMDDVTLEEAAKLIENRYAVKVRFNNEKVKLCRFTAAFLNRNDITQVLNVIGDITGAKIMLKDNKVSIDGNGC